MKRPDGHPLKQSSRTIPDETFRAVRVNAGGHAMVRVGDTRWMNCRGWP